MFSKRCDQKELMDDLDLHDITLKKNLKEIEMTNRWFGSEKTLISALEIIYKKQKTHFNQELVIADLGCGSGDLLKVMSRWATSKKLNIKLIGLDANSFMIDFAKQQTQVYSNIFFEKINVVSEDFEKMKFDITTLNSFCHHLNNEELIDLLQRIQQQTKIAIIINDLHRHWLPYFAIKWFSRLGNFTYLIKHDGPLSVLRAFRKNELINIMQKASLSQYQIKWNWLFRWQMIIWCNLYKDIEK